MKTGNRREFFAYIFIICLVIIFMFQSPLNFWVHDGDTGLDSSVFKTVALYMEKGYMPYRDTFDHKGPVLYILNWLGLKLSYWRGIWIIEFFSMLITFFFLYKTARLSCSSIKSIAVLLISTAPLYSFFLGGNFAEEYALTPIAVSFFIFADYFINKRISRLRLFICGFCFGTVFLLRPNMVALWFVFCVAVLIHTILEKETMNLFQFLLWFLLGVAAIIVPVLVWLYINNSFKDFVYDYFVFNGLYSRDNYHTSLQERVNSFLSFFGSETLLAFLIVSYSSFKRKNFFCGACSLCILISLLFICVSGTAFPHYGMILVPLLVYPFSLLLHEEKEATNSIFSIPALVALFLLVYISLPRWFSGFNTMVSILDPAGEDSFNSFEVTEVCEYVKAHTGEEERIAVWGSSDIIYAKTKRLCATKYTYVTPIAFLDEKIFPEYYAELEICRPKLIIKFDAFSLTPEIWDFMDRNGYVHVDEIGAADIYELPDI